MNSPTPADIIAAVEATWPAAARERLGPWIIRTGLGGGSRVSATTAEGAVAPGDIADAEQAMARLDQRRLFMIREGDEAFDTMLAEAGYVIMDPVTAYVAPVGVIATARPGPTTTFPVWPPLPAQATLWAEAGIGPARLGVMARAPDPRVTILGRLDDRPAGSVFVACHGGIAMLHALEVAKDQRRRGLGLAMMRAAAFWAADNGAAWFSLVVTRANQPANALYLGLGMQAVTHYHYRIHPDDAPR